MPDPQFQLDRPWHSLDLKQVPAVLETDLDHGLTEAEAESRLQRFGPDAVTERRQEFIPSAPRPVRPIWW